MMEMYANYLRLQGGKRRQIRVERWLEQLALEERGSKGVGSKVWQEGGLREVSGGSQHLGGGRPFTGRDREENQGIERTTKDKSFDMVSQ